MKAQQDFKSARIVIIIGSKDSDLPVLQDAKVFELLNEIGVTWTVSAISTHRNPKALEEYVTARAKDEKTKVFLAVAGKSAVLPGMVKAYSRNIRPIPVVGLALPSTPFGVKDALYATISMPKGMVVHTFLDPVNAALAACEIVAVGDQLVARKLLSWQQKNNPRQKIDFMKGAK